MKQYLKYSGILIILLFVTSVKSQVFTFKSTYVSGMIKDDSTKDTIPFAHIYNESQRRGFIANKDGKFQIPINAGDTLIVSALGFFPRVIFHTEYSLEQENIITLAPQLYEIGEVSVRAFRDYDDFKRQFLALELTKTQTDKLRNNLTTIARKEAKQADYERLVKESLERPGLLIYSVPIHSKGDQQLLYYAEILKKEARQRVINQKYNREIIFRITQFSEDEITEFMGFCNFSEEYLYEASEYDILVKIEEKFKEYNLMKESGSFYMDGFSDLYNKIS